MQRTVLEKPVADYSEVTELADDDVSQEQVERAARRYGWALTFCEGKDVLEVACGTGAGLGLLRTRARSVIAGDVSDTMVERARRHYGDRIPVRRMDAQHLPFDEASFDVIILFEALYYLPDAKRFVSECARVLRPGGTVLVSNANKDLFDFNPSPHSYQYHGVAELTHLFEGFGFETRFWGDTPVRNLSPRQKMLRPVKRMAVRLGLMPTSMAGKKILKRLVFGSMVPFPRELTYSMLPPLNLPDLPAGTPDRLHKVIFCAARKIAAPSSTS